MTTDKSLNCSFCGKSRDNVEKLIAGPGVYICNECITISYQILDTQDDELCTDPDLCGIPSPKEIHAFLDEYISGQEETKRILSTSAYNHYKRINHKNKNVELEKSNVLLIGPTGSGKTLFAKTLAKKLNVPFAIADATTLTEAGYVGDDVESVLERLLSVADYDIESAQKGVIYIDEIDKKTRKSESNTTRDVSGEGVQQALLRLIEGTVTKVKLASGKKFGEEYVEFDTTNVLFILGGAFVGIEDTISRRVQKSSSIGFTGKVLGKSDKANLLPHLVADDVVKYGLIPELVGRVPIITTLMALTEEQMIHILTNVKNSVIAQVKELLKYDGIELEFGNGYYAAVAKKATEVKLGARAIKTIVESSLFYIMYNAPDLHNSGVVKVTFDNYPSKNYFPTITYTDGRTETLTEYTFFRGINEEQ
jgi:ATP-dependent Clp protease ATP-binding subunit ClpX